MGVANKKSIAWAIAKRLESEGALVLYSVRNESRRQSLFNLLEGKLVYICDVEKPEEIENLAHNIGTEFAPLDGIVHSIAFANFTPEADLFYKTKRSDFLQATTISCFSLVEVANAFKDYLNKNASVVSISISSQVTAENYGYMSPIKAALDSASRFLAKSFSHHSNVRFNTVNAGPLKTSASAGIPGYLDNYLYAEKMTMRKEALKTEEVADTAVFLLSERSSGINAQSIVVNAGMDINYFDKELVDAVTRVDTNK